MIGFMENGNYYYGVVLGFRYPYYWELYWDYWRDPFLYAKLTASKDNCPGSQRHTLPPTDMHADGKPLLEGQSSL